VAVIFDNLKVGMRTLFGTPIIRSLFIVGAFMFIAFGLWNVLLLPFSITVLGASEFEYGLQEGLTSVGFVIGSLLMARFSRLLPEPAWIVFSLATMGVLGILYANSTSVPVAIFIVALSGLAQPPSSVSRSVLLQRNTPREMRGRVFSAFYVMRDIIFLIGMAGAGLADFVEIRLLIIFASCLLFVSAAFTLVAPGLGFSTWGAAARRLRSAEGPGLAASPSRAATLADFDRLAVRLGVFNQLSLDQRIAFVHEASVREVPGGTKIIEHGDEAMSAFFILDGSTTAGIPADDGYHGLSTMNAGDFFGEIGALTGSVRTADVVADVDSTLLEVPSDALRATMAVPEIQKVVQSTMSSRLQRTDAADLPRLAGVGQAELRDLRTPRPSVEALPHDEPAASG
jgi:MFS family permease